MEETDQRAAESAAPDVMLAEQLAQCHKVVSGCFEFCGHSDVAVSQQLEVFNVMSRLMRASVALAAALDKSPREFVHRVIVERPAVSNQAPMVDVTPAGNLAHETAKASFTAGDPPPPMKMSKTIHGGEPGPRHNG